MFPQTSSYRTQTVVLTTINTPYSLAALLLAIDPKFPLAGREVTLSVDKFVPGTILFGESNLSSTNCGYALTELSPPRTYRSDKSDIPLGMIWVMGSAALMIVNVEVVQ